VSELHAHMAKSAETDHADLLALGDAPVAHGGVGRDPGAKEHISSPKETTMKESLEPEITASEAAGIFLVLCTALLLWIVWVSSFLDKLTALQIAARLFWNG
jgi:hypothetical protein